MPKRSSTARGREFGSGLRKAITNAGFTSRALAELGVLLGICRVSPAERDHLLALFPAAHVRDWLQHPGPDEFDPLRTFVENLATAERLINWELHRLPILLQTRAYMRAETAASVKASAGELEARVQARLEMQQALRRRSLKCVLKTVVRSLEQISLNEEESKTLIAALGEQLSAGGPAPQAAW